MKHVEIIDGILDPGIAQFVKTLQEHGIETYESCEGGKGHSFPEPTIRFSGGPAQGYKGGVGGDDVWSASGQRPPALLARARRRTGRAFLEMTFYKKATHTEGVSTELASASAD